MRYCLKSSEIAVNPRAAELIEKIAHGDDDAFRWMWSLWSFTHLFDDLVDKDKPVTPEEAAAELTCFVVQMSLNPFYLRYSTGLVSLLVSAINRWMMGDELARSTDNEARIMGRAVRCGDVDLYLHVAYLTGGWEHMRAMSALVQYDKE